MSFFYVKRKSVFIAGTALLGATVIVLDWTSKAIPGLRTPFIPPLTFLKFDVLGIPMLLAYFMFGLPSGAMSSIVAWFSISFRDPFSGFMKFLAEFSTIMGVYVVLRIRRPSSYWWKALSMISGVVVRVGVTAAANLLLLPIFTTTRMEFVLAWLHYFSLFNAIQGAISVFGGFLVYEAVASRLPALKMK